jgi:creatinine amidohydrolase/Fe(II)-dependent formamide hydrolase-like protein
MAKNRKTREIGPLTKRMALSPGSLNEEARTVEVVWTTGARVLRGGFDRYYEELSLDPAHVRMERLQNGAPVLNTHNQWELSDQIAVVEDARLEDGQGVAVLRFPQAGIDENADRIFRLVADGIIRNISVGYRVYSMEIVEDGEAEIPVMRAVDWEPFELSFVPVGADADSRTRGDAAQTNPCEFVSRQEQNMAKQNQAADNSAPNPTTDETRANPAPVPPTLDESKVRAEAAAAERKRVAEVMDTGRALELDEDFVREHLNAGTPIADFRKLAIDQRASAQRNHPDPTPSAPVIEPGEDARDKRIRGMAAALHHRAGNVGHIKEWSKRTGEAVDLDGGEFRSMRLIDMARDSLERQGVRTRGMLPQEIADVALSRSAATTSDFPVVLQNVMGKRLLAAHEIASDTWRNFCSTGSVPDFRQSPRIRVGSIANLEIVNEAGEVRNTAVPDGRRENASVQTRGNILSVTRETLVNDDMDAFNRLPAAFGRAAARSIEALVYSTLGENSGAGPDMADGDPMFHANHDNIGAGAALTAANIDANRVIMKEQQDESGYDYLALVPAVLLVNTALGGLARKINEAEDDPDTTGDRSPNPVRGTFRTIVDTPRVSGTRRYLFADPAEASVLEVTYLNGQETPMLMQFEEPRVLALQWRLIHDFGVNPIGFRGAVYDAGQ